MKVKLEIDPNAEDEILIKTKAITPEIKRLYQTLQKENAHADQIEAFKNNISYYLPLEKILFFETDSKQVMAHTKQQAYQVKYKLYELEDLLKPAFMRISKSAVLNLDQIYSLTKSISDCKVQFYDSYKTVYASRHYYRALRDRLAERRKLS